MAKAEEKQKRLKVPRPPAPTSPAITKAMKGNKRANTKPELLVRQRLREAGLTVDVGLMELECQHLNEAFFQYITYLNPLRYALEVVHSVYLADAGIGHIKNEIIPMLIIAGITMPLAAWAFRRQL